MYTVYILYKLIFINNIHNKSIEVKIKSFPSYNPYKHNRLFVHTNFKRQNILTIKLKPNFL